MWPSTEIHQPSMKWRLIQRRAPYTRVVTAMHEKRAVPSPTPKYKPSHAPTARRLLDNIQIRRQNVSTNLVQTATRLRRAHTPTALAPPQERGHGSVNIISGTHLNPVGSASSTLPPEERQRLCCENALLKRGDATAYYQRPMDNRRFNPSTTNMQRLTDGKIKQHVKESTYTR